MATFELNITTDNAAFDGEFLRSEVANILRDAAGDVLDGADAGRLADVNGNAVGSYAFLPDDPMDQAREVERGDLPSGSVVVKLTGERSAHSPGARS